MLDDNIGVYAVVLITNADKLALVEYCGLLRTTTMALLKLVITTASIFPSPSISPIAWALVNEPVVKSTEFA